MRDGASKQDDQIERKGRYRKVEVKVFGDAKFQALTPIPPCGQGLWLYFLIGPHTSSIPGLYHIGRAAMAEALGWELEDFDKAFLEVSGQDMVKADWKARLVWLPNAIKHNHPESPNVVKGWASTWEVLPECTLKLEAYEAIYAELESFSNSMLEAFVKSCPKPFYKGSLKALLKTKPNQEQEQEQEQKKDKASVPAAGASETTQEFQLTGDQSDKPVPECPHDEVIKLYHQILPELRRVKVWNEARQTFLRSRWREDKKHQNLEWWAKFFRFVRTCPLLMGDHTSKDHPGWQADLEWLVRPKNFVNVIEGKYLVEERTGA